MNAAAGWAARIQCNAEALYIHFHFHDIRLDDLRTDPGRCNGLSG